MLRINKSSNSPSFLCLGNDMKSNSRLTRTFRTINLDYPASWHTANP